MNIEELKFISTQNNSKTAICLFHGYGASMHDLFGLGDYLDPQGKYEWIFPDGHLASDFGGRAWFPIDMVALQQAMMSGQHRSFSKIYTKEFQLAVELGKEFVKNLLAKYDKVLIGGFSQGAMISSHISLELSKDLSGLILFSGNLIGQEELIKKLEQSVKFNFFQSHGKQDQVLSYQYAKSLFELFKLGGHQGEFVTFDGGHEIPVEVLSKVKSYISKQLD